MSDLGVAIEIQIGKLLEFPSFIGIKDRIHLDLLAFLQNPLIGHNIENLFFFEFGGVY